MAKDNEAAEAGVNQVGGIDPAGKAQIIAVDAAGQVKTLPAAPVAADILVGRQSFTATTAATTLITVPAGRTWSGVVGASVSVAVAAASSTAGQANATFSVVGTGATPAAGAYFAVDAKAAANAATGTVGSNAANFGSAPFTVVAPAGNAVTIAVATTNTGTASLVDAFAAGSLV